jgi:hypothetical protein
MVNPSNPEIKGNSEVEHDGRANSAHEEEVKKAESNKGGEESAEVEAGANLEDEDGEIKE